MIKSIVGFWKGEPKRKKPEYQECILELKKAADTIVILTNPKIPEALDEIKNELAASKCKLNKLIIAYRKRTQRK